MNHHLRLSLSLPAALLLGACSSTSATTQSSDSGGGTDTGSSSGGGDDAGSSSSGGADGAAGDSTLPDAGGPASDSSADSPGSGPAGDAGVCATCHPGTVCLEHQVSGGALIMPDDAGQCMNGRVLSPGPPALCVVAPTFQCATLPGACSNPPGTPAIAHCTCATSLCASGEVCTDVTPTLMRCQLLAP
jgi:hypothetical protein